MQSSTWVAGIGEEEGGAPASGSLAARSVGLLGLRGACQAPCPARKTRHFYRASDGFLCLSSSGNWLGGFTAGRQNHKSFKKANFDIT